MRLFKKEDIYNKNIVLRLDLNVPMKDTIVLNDYKIKKSLKTLEFLKMNSKKVIVLSHLGKLDKNNQVKSLYPIKKILENYLNEKILFISNENSFSEINKIILESNQKFIMLENTRYYDKYNDMESKCLEELSKFYASLGEVFINDAFGSSHRKHASTFGISKYLPGYFGFLIEEEINNLTDLNNNNKIFTVVVGGSKVESKLPLIENLLDKCNYILMGGGILNSFLKASGFDIKDSLATNDIDILNKLKYLLEKYPDKIILNYDVVWDENKIKDVNASVYKKYIEESELCFVNGTLGLYEEEKFSSGTKQLFNIVCNSNAKTIVGGGDAVSALFKLGNPNKVSFISTGGGATLKYIIKNELEIFNK